MLPVIVATWVSVLSAEFNPSLDTKVVVVVGGIVVVGGVVVIVVDVVEVVVGLDVVVSADTETLDVDITDPTELQAETKTTRERTTATMRHASFFQQKVIDVYFLTQPKSGGTEVRSRSWRDTSD